MFQTSRRLFGSAILLFALIVAIPVARADGPTDESIRTELKNRTHFDIVGGNLKPLNRPDEARPTPIPIANANGTIIEWSSGKNTTAAQYGPAGKAVTGDVWRLTEIESTKDDFKATTTTFYKHGLRSKTYCAGKLDATSQCVTASRNLCENFKIRNKDPEITKGLNIDVGDSGRRANLLALGQQCSNYAEYLNKTLNPNVTLTGHERSARDEQLVESDLAAIRNVKSALKNSALKDIEIGGMDAWLGTEDKVGASTTGMKNRAARMRETGQDFLSLSQLAFICADATFVEQSSGVNYPVNPGKPQKKSTKQ